VACLELCLAEEGNSILNQLWWISEGAAMMNFFDGNSVYVPWTEAEDNRLLHDCLTFGPKRKFIIKQGENRSAVQLESRWFSVLRYASTCIWTTTVALQHLWPRTQGIAPSTIMFRRKWTDSKIEQKRDNDIKTRYFIPCAKSRSLRGDRYTFKDRSREKLYHRVNFLVAGCTLSEVFLDWQENRQIVIGSWEMSRDISDRSRDVVCISILRKDHFDDLIDTEETVKKSQVFDSPS
jgi:hypothetical protein